MTFWQKWIAFFSPMPGWKARYTKFLGGGTTWSVPGKPDKPQLIPFPLPWMPHRLKLTEEDDEAAHTRGFVFLPGVCADTGQRGEIGVIVSCLRCAVPLHPSAAHMYGGFDPPYCNRCKWVIKLLL